MTIHRFLCIVAVLLGGVVLGLIGVLYLETEDDINTSTQQHNVMVEEDIEIPVPVPETMTVTVVGEISILAPCGSQSVPLTKTSPFSGSKYGSSPIAIHSDDGCFIFSSYATDGLVDTLVKQDFVVPVKRKHFLCVFRNLEGVMEAVPITVGEETEITISSELFERSVRYSFVLDKLMLASM